MITSATVRLPAPAEAALRRLEAAAVAACERTVESLGLSALTATGVTQRDSLLAAQFELNRKSVVFCQAFKESLADRVTRELRLRQGAPDAPSRWDTLTLMDDHELESQVVGDRLGQAIGHGCEWELRELEGYVGPLYAAAGQRRQEHDRNPLRPESIGHAVIRGIEAVSDRPDVHRVLEAEFTRTLAATLPQTYVAIAADLRAAGLRADGMAVRPSESRAGDLGRYGPTTRPGSLNREPVPTTASQAGALGRTPPPPAGASTGRGGSTPMGQVDAELMALMRRLATADFARSSSDFGATSDAGAFAHVSAEGLRLAAPNVIRAHRDELRQIAAGGLDHMVIDLVGSLFDQILSDPKVPPQMARQIGRLQVPVLRTALGDPSFFSSRKHPVRRFINRLASLAAALEDLGDAQGREFLTLVRELVQGIVDGDFDHADTYERQLVQLEQFVAEQARREVSANGDAPALLAEREAEIRVQQRYAAQLEGALRVLPAPDFLRDFLSVAWSQVLVRASRRGAADPSLAQRMRHAARELVMSVQPKGTAAQRKEFIAQLPKLMQELNEGMDLIGWPETAKKTFFGSLLPAHAQSLKSEGLSTLDYNLLARQVDQIFDKPLPSADALPAVADPGSIDEAAILPTFTREEQQRLGLMPESAVDWDGQVDIDLGAEPAVTAVDIAIDGMPAPEPVEPTRGGSLADHVQIGFAYQMHLQGGWQKVRLNHVSPGRTFFVFTYGQRHKQTVSLTYRMLLKLCETGRLRAFENAYLLERATARARRQLAALRPAPMPPGGELFRSASRAG